jgi:hypothetical protein
VELVISHDHAGLRKAIAEVFAEAAWQRCYVHFLRNALDYVPRKADNDCLTELRWIYDLCSIDEARQDLAAWLRKWVARYPKLCDWGGRQYRDADGGARRSPGPGQDLELGARLFGFVPSLNADVRNAMRDDDHDKSGTGSHRGSIHRRVRASP